MNINIICVGKLKEKYLRDASAEYEKRLSRYCRVQIRELKEARLAENASPAEEEAVKTEEGKSILKALSSSSFVIVLDIGGKRAVLRSAGGKNRQSGDDGREYCRFYHRRLSGPVGGGEKKSGFPSLFFTDDLSSPAHARDPAGTDLPFL